MKTGYLSCLFLFMLLFIRRIYSNPLVPLCCDKNETVEICQARITHGTLFHNQSTLISGYNCPIETRYRCSELEMREHNSNGDFNFNGITYNKYQYCFDENNNFCLLYCVTPICCSSDMRDIDCVTEYISKNGTIIIPTNVTRTCSNHEYKVDICNKYAKIDDHYIILENCGTVSYKGKYCLYIFEEGNCEEKCLDDFGLKSYISYTLPRDCPLKEFEEKCLNVPNLPNVELLTEILNNCVGEKNCSFTEILVKDKKICIDLIEDIKKWCVDRNSNLTVSALINTIQSHKYISRINNNQLVPLCCYKNETEETCRTRITHGTLFHNQSTLIPGYNCPIETRYRCSEQEMRKHNSNGDFNFNGVTYNKYEYCLDEKNNFCLLYCVTPICCSSDMTDIECVTEYISKNGTIIIPTNVIRTCSNYEYKVDICIKYAKIDDHYIILENCGTASYKEKYCFYIYQEGNCEQICLDDFWMKLYINYTLPRGCMLKEFEEHYLNKTNLPNIEFLMKNLDYCVGEQNGSFTEIRVRDDRICVDLMENLKKECVDGNSNFPISAPVVNTIQSNKWGMIISIPFLLATIIVYILLPERNLHMKALMFYIGNLMLAYIILVTIQLGEQLEDTLCKVMGFLCLFLFTASIVWMNVICLDIFLTFSGFFGLRGHKKKENRRLVYYILYGFLFPSALILVTFLVNVYGDRKNNFYPGIGEGSCFLKNGLPHILYFQGPVGVLLLVNIVLFTLTAFKIRKAKQDTKVLKTAENRKSNENDNKKFNLYLKLLFAMGINWSMETISWFFENYTSLPRWLWYITDFCNAIYGVFIFVLFACKKRHWKILKRKYYTLIGRPILGHSMSQTQQTRTTGSISDTQANGENIQLQSVRDNP